MAHPFRSIGTAAACAVLAACAAPGVILPEGTLLLGEATHVLTPADVDANRLGSATKVDKLRERLHAWGYTDDQLAAGRIVVVRQGIYWHNVVSGIEREMLRPALVPAGLVVEPGNVVEGRETDPARGGYRIERVRAASRQEGRCRYVDLPTGLVKGLMGTASKVGPSGAATLYCEGIEAEGWERPRTYWHKLPAGAAARP